MKYQFLVVLISPFPPVLLLHLLLASQPASSNGIGLKQLCWSALKHHFASVASSTRTDIDNVVGSHHHVPVVLNDDDGVTYVAQGLEGVDESHIVALMQTDARFIEDVKHIHQLRTNLCGQSDTLAFSTRE